MAKIHEAIPRIMAEIGVIGKGRKNVQQNYQFRGIDDVYNAAQAALIKEGVFSVPEVLNMQRDSLQSKSGGTLLYTFLTVKYTFFADDGSWVSAVVTGEGMDSGDKSCNKAMSAAQKYAFLQVFCIPTEEPKDSENDHHEVAGKGKVADKAPMPADETTGALTALLNRVQECKNVFELKAWYEKHKTLEIAKMAPKDKKILVSAVTAMRAKLEEAEKAKNETENQKAIDDIPDFTGTQEEAF